MLNFIVDTTSCTRCGECRADCPARIIAMVDGVPTITPETGRALLPHRAA